MKQDQVADLLAMIRKSERETLQIVRERYDAMISEICIMSGEADDRERVAE